MFKSLKDWSTFAGGTRAAAGKHGYDLHLEAITYTIQPVSSRSGWHAGYVLSRAVTGRGCLREDLVGLHGYIGPDGSEGGAAGFINRSAFRSPQAAHTAARKHWERYVKPATPGTGNGKRRSAPSAEVYLADRSIFMPDQRLTQLRKGDRLEPMRGHSAGLCVIGRNGRARGHIDTRLLGYPDAKAWIAGTGWTAPVGGGGKRRSAPAGAAAAQVKRIRRIMRGL